MNARPWLGLLLVGFGLTAGAPAVQAQSRLPRPAEAPRPDQPSHIPIPLEDIEDLGNPQELLARRLQRSRDLSEMEKLALEFMKNFSPEQAKKFRELASKYDKDDPEVRKRLGEMIEKNKRELSKSNPNLTPEQLKKFEALLKRPPLEPAKPFEGGKPQPKGEDAATPESLPNPKPSQKKRNQPSLGSGADAERQKAREAATQAEMARVLQYAKQLEGMAGSLNRSPTWRKIMGELGRLSAKPGGGAPKPPSEDSWFKGLTDMGKAGTKAGGSLLDKDALPSLPSLKWPSAPSFGGGLPSVEVPSVGRPGVGLGTVGSLLLWLLAAVLVGVILWRVLTAGRDTLALRRQRAARELGPWPVHPAAVRTRQELIQAFEYLSLLLLGPAVRSWNHLEIASGMGSPAAGELALLYEQARYAPPQEPLPDPELEAARRHLCHLAGVRGA
jgi:hypothetical protein